MGKLNGKTAFITGGNSGIGLAAARLFVAEGAQVAITGRKQETLDAAVRELGPNAFGIRADAKEIGDTERAVAAAVERYGKLDVVFANAGIAASTPLGGTELATFEEVLKTNVTGVFFTVQTALPHLKAGASVILTGSVLASSGGFGHSAYAASKGAVGSMAKVLASELAPLGIRVNTLVPGATRTPIWGSSTGEEREKLEAALARGIPLSRLAEAEEVAKAALFLASDDSSFIQAADIIVDGGAIGAPLGAPVYRRV